MHACNLQYSSIKCMNVFMHAQFCRDPVVESVIIGLPRVSFPVSQVVACHCSFDDGCGRTPQL